MPRGVTAKIKATNIVLSELKNRIDYTMGWRAMVQGRKVIKRVGEAAEEGPLRKHACVNYMSKDGSMLSLEEKNAREIAIRARTAELVRLLRQVFPLLARKDHDGVLPGQDLSFAAVMFHKVSE